MQARLEEVAAALARAGAAVREQDSLPDEAQLAEDQALVMAVEAVQSFEALRPSGALSPSSPRFSIAATLRNPTRSGQRRAEPARRGPR